jgi:ATP-dependent Lhr-like helicase
VESLRASLHEAPASEAVTISVADPLNLVGIIVPGERAAANSGKTITLIDGVATSAAEAYRGFSQAVAI